MQYTTKNRIKTWLLVVAVSIVGIFILLLNNTISNIKNDERKQVMLWADAVQRRYALVEYTNSLFHKLAKDERKKVIMWSEAQKLIIETENPDFLTFLLKIIQGNKNIPIIMTNSGNVVVDTVNMDYNIELNKPIPQKLRKQFTQYPPITITYENKPINYLYYADSKLFSELQSVMNDMVKSFIEEVVKNSVSVPVLITSADSSQIIAYGNIDSTRINSPHKLSQTISEMSEHNTPITIKNDSQTLSYIFYEDSLLLTRLSYYPYILILISISLLAFAYYAFRSSQRFEQNQLWVGMSKETAHQLGTPISSLMAWIEILKQEKVREDIIGELNKDITRLNTITNRFSKIGSQPKLVTENIYSTITKAIGYMKQRSPTKVQYTVTELQKNCLVHINSALFEWVIENICKNAIDAMQGNGHITLYISGNEKNVFVDIEDTGKGMSRKIYKQIFKPGFSTKTRGWGLGLNLAQRIIEEYHNGKIFVKYSANNKGTTFRISLPRVS
ncbi:MAG: HAMP domain-containing sensor histidine kinase [Bacteroidales bacterium]